jgi:imidazolonepropionase-like amidohydrolase
MELLHEAGIPASDILKMTGENAARAMGLDDIGVIAAGRRADLVLLTRDPRANMRNTRSIAWMMQGGRLVSKGPRP